MPESNDQQLLAEFASSESNTAFAALVARYVNLVHSTALRSTFNPHHAEEITQAVFVILSRKAGKLPPRTVLSGWLYQTARLTAANFMKGEIRRQKREQEAYMQSTLNERDPAAWKQIAPMLDEAMGRLGEADRNAIVLRFFENKTDREAGAALKITEATARKRVNRALEKLRRIFTKRGVVLSSTLIASAVTAHSVQAAPPALAATVAASAAKGISIPASITTLVKGTMKTMTWLKLKFAAGVCLAALITGGLATVAISQTAQSGGGAAGASPQAGGGATSGNPFVNSLGMKFVPVPGTEVLFSIWDTRVQDFLAYAGANPAVNKSRPGVPFKQGEDHPVVMVSWEDANAFCAWLTQKERKAGKIGQDQEYRLPTDKEWSAAVGQDKYPWGNDWPPPKGAGNYADETLKKEQPRYPHWIEGYDDGYACTSPVGSFKANQNGLYDMGGNVWQWCEDFYRSDMNEQALLDKDPMLKDDGGGAKYRVKRGACWNLDVPEFLLSSARIGVAPNGRDDLSGFRCVLVSGLQAGGKTSAAPGPAGVVIVEDQQFVGKNQEILEAGRDTITIKGDKIREEGPLISINIHDLKTGDFLAVFPNTKKFMKSKDNGPVNVAVAALPKVVDTGKQEKVGDYSTEIYTAQTRVGKITIWVTQDIPNSASIREQMKKMDWLPEYEGLGGDLLDASKIGGIPVKMEIPKWEIKQFVNNVLTPFATVATVTMLSAKDEPVDDADFEIPADYTEQAYPAKQEKPADAATPPPQP